MAINTNTSILSNDAQSMCQVTELSLVTLIHEIEEGVLNSARMGCRAFDFFPDVNIDEDIVTGIMECFKSKLYVVKRIPAGISDSGDVYTKIRIMWPSSIMTQNV